MDSQIQLTIGLKKIDKKLCEATEGKIDPTNRLTNKIQRKLCKFWKEKKIASKITKSQLQFSTTFNI